VACRTTTKPLRQSDGSPAPKISDAGQAVAQACPRRLYLPTADARLIAINADTGKVCEGFGNKGVIDLTPASARSPPVATTPPRRRRSPVTW
jgi:glucose dehydrogenase